MVVAIRSRLAPDATSDDYFVSGRNLRWWSIGASTIATNLQAGHFLAVVGSAYAFGLAQANFELNAVLGLVLGLAILSKASLVALLRAVGSEERWKNVSPQKH